MSSLESSSLLEELVALEREAIRLSMRTSDLERFRVPGLEQGLSQSWGLSFGRCLTTITGRIIGGDSPATPLAGATIQVTGHTSGINYGTFAATDGTYAIPLMLDPSDTSIDVVATGPGIRFTAGSPVNRSTPTSGRCQVISLADIKATPASGYQYVGGGLPACKLPVKSTLNYTSPTIGDGTIVMGVPICMQWTSRTTANCTTSRITALQLQFSPNSGVSFIYWATGIGLGGECPVTQTCPGGPGFFRPCLPTITSSQTCPTDPDSSTGYSFLITTTIPTNHVLFAPGPFTLEFYE